LITFNSEVHEAYLNTIWGPGGDGVDWSLVNNTGGTGFFRYVALGLKPNNNFTTTGTQTLLKLTFDIVNPTTNSMKETPLHFDINKLSNVGYQEIVHSANDGTVQIWGTTPTLSLNPLIKECRMLNQEFDIAVNVANALSLTSLTFDIRYDAQLLDFVSVTWGVWGSGLEDHSVDGTFSGSTNGGAQDGTQLLLTIRLKAAFSHIWKDELTIPGWQNILTGNIYIQSATLDYPTPQPDLTYTRGGTGNKINVGSDVTYTWSPIQGDVELDGDVDIFDLRDVSAFYDQTNETWNLTGASGLIDIFDLVVIANNFGFTYTP